MKRLMMTTILMLATTSNFSLAQAPADHDAHHPPQATSPAPAQPAPPPGQPGMGSMPMMNMMSGMMNDMSMMNMMETMRSMRMMGPGGGGMATIDRIEGRIAFLRAELKITDAQAGVWNAFAETLRANAKKLGEMRSSMMPQAGAGQQQAPTIIERVELQERWMQARLEGTRTMKTALSKLYESLVGRSKEVRQRTPRPAHGNGDDDDDACTDGTGSDEAGPNGSGPALTHHPSRQVASHERIQLLPRFQAWIGGDGVGRSDRGLSALDAHRARSLRRSLICCCSPVP